jgi:hypothetical protein
MLRLLILWLVVSVICSSCALNKRDRQYLRHRGVAGDVFAKMKHHEPLDLDDIIELSHQSVSGPFIVHYLRPTYYVYHLTSDDIARLQRSGVEEGVIRYLVATPAMFSPASVPLQYQEDPHFGGDYDFIHRY